MEEKKEKKKGKSWLVAAVLLLIVAGGAIGLYIADKAAQKKAEDRLEQLAEEANAEPEAVEKETPEAVDQVLTLEEKIRILEEKYGIAIPEKNLDFKQLREDTNKDIYAWICLPGTVIDYPVVQHPSDEAYYLEHNLDGSKGYPGCIYSQSYNKKDFSDRMTVLYGHNMKDGTIFAGLHNYEDADFFKENPYVFLYTENDIFVYKIFAAYAASDEHLLFNYDWTIDRIFLDYLAGIQERKDLSRNVDREIELTADSQILTLSTCIGGVQNKRYLVQGVLLREDF